MERYLILSTSGHKLSFLATGQMDITKNLLEYSFFEIHANGLAADAIAKSSV